jgi:hypothetical protein
MSVCFTAANKPNLYLDAIERGFMGHGWQSLSMMSRPDIYLDRRKIKAGL